MHALTTLKEGLGGFGPVAPRPGAKGPSPDGGPPLKSAPLATPPAMITKKVRRSLKEAQVLSCPPDRDIVLIVDSSGSVGRHNFNKSITDLSNLIPYLCGFQPKIITWCRSTRLAVVTYGEEPRLVFGLNDSAIRHTYQENVQNDIKEKTKYLQFLSSATATGDALQFVAEQVLRTDRGMRAHSKKTILLLTDGQSNTGSEPVKVASRLYRQYDDLAIVALGIGSRVNYDELLGITNHYNPFNPLVLYLENYQNFSDIVSEIVKYLSEGQNTCEPGADILEKKRK
jgi:uncharacterized protein YegL